MTPEQQRKASAEAIRTAAANLNVLVRQAAELGLTTRVEVVEERHMGQVGAVPTVTVEVLARL
jgi:hypothetical protein